MLPCTFVSHKFMKCSMPTCDHTVDAKFTRDTAFPVPLFQHDDSMHWPVVGSMMTAATACLRELDDTRYVLPQATIIRLLTGPWITCTRVWPVICRPGVLHPPFTMGYGLLRIWEFPTPCCCLMPDSSHINQSLSVWDAIHTNTQARTVTDLRHTISVQSAVKKDIDTMNTLMLGPYAYPAEEIMPHW